MAKELLASKTIILEEEPRIRQIQGVPTNVLGMIGITERGPIAELKRVLSFEEWASYFGGDILNGEASHAVRGFFQNGGQVLDFVRTVHFTDASVVSSKHSDKGSYTIPTAATSATAGSVLGTALAPFNLEPSDTLIVAVDGAGGTTATFTAVAAAVQCATAENYALVNGYTLIFHIDAAAEQTIAFLTSEFVSIGAATAEEVAAVINAKCIGAHATVTSGGTKVTITSDTRGTASVVHITGGTANAILGFSTGSVAGTGNVAAIDAVSIAEVKTVVELAVAGVTVSNSGGYAKITRNSAGASYSVQVTAPSTSDDELGFDNATHSGTSGAAQSTLKMWGKYDGTYVNDVTVAISNASSGVASEFNLRVLDGGLVMENFANLTMDSTADRYVETIVNHAKTGSQLVSAEDVDAVGTTAQRRPAVTVTVHHGPLAGGLDGIDDITAADFVGDVGGPTGLRVLDQSLDLALLAVPDMQGSTMHNAMITYCETIRDGQVFAILDPPAGYSKTDICTYVDTTAALYELSEFAAIYWPQVKVINPNKNLFGLDETIIVPPSGHIAGVYARTDASQPGGVYNQPAGIERGILRGVVGFEDDDVKQETCRDLIYPKHINPLTTAPGLPLHIDGVYALKTSSNFPTVAERRGVTYIEQSIKRGTQFARHGDNTDTSRARVNRTIAAFLLVQFNNKAFRGTTPAASFFVDTGLGLNPPSEQFAMKMNIRIGLATKKPAEFIIIRVSQDTRALEEELAAATA